MTATFDADIQKTALDKKPDLCACIFSQEIRRAPLPVRTACPDCHFAFWTKNVFERKHAAK